MPLISNLELTLIIPKSIEAALFIMNIYLINKKNKQTAWKDRSQFHKSLLIGMFAWVLYITLDMVIYTCAGLSMDETTPMGIYQGYDFNYQSLFWVNILRDIAFGASTVMNWNFLIAAFALRYDEERVKAVFTNNAIVIILMGAITIIISAGDIIQILISSIGIDVSGIFNGFAGFSIALNVIIYLISALMLYLTLKDIAIEDPSKDFKKRITFFMWGIIFLGIGHIYWVILGVITLISPMILVLPTLFYYILGHLFWIISPVFIFYGFGKVKKTSITVEEN
ncbi:hypothetical protein NEF87_002159 [Candidatus Lokiarchaeum ossiferum]|uniref:DUF998 domain-containing protein n=1 Tax=Candidatus Lokiarchaeum ossiferum TaxID=2951803 RepID=A0ABY6HTJ6_9ARCH|nr:hypothetical protein NEF87_002159 [Candidatus Lokiarchaeum sp. B-35]